MAGGSWDGGGDVTARSREELVREIAGYVLLVVGALILLALVSYHPRDPSFFSAGSDTYANWLSRGGAALAGVLVSLFGIPALVIPGLILAVGWKWLQGKQLEYPWLQGAAWAVALACAAGLGTLIMEQIPYRGDVLIPGGDLGRAVRAGLESVLGFVGAVVVCLAGLVAGTVFGVRSSLAHLLRRGMIWLKERRTEAKARRVRRRMERERSRLGRAVVKRHLERLPAATEPPLVWREVEGRSGFRIRGVRRVGVVAEKQPPAAEPTRPGQAPPRPPRRTPPRVEVIPTQEVFDFVRDTPASGLPEKTMLSLPPPPTDLDPRRLAAMREMVETRCREFRVEGRVEDVSPGPVITTYEFRPAAGVKYAQVAALEEDLALGLQVEAVRIERIPGKATIGLEVPNPGRHMIVLRDVVESSKFTHSASPLTLALGQDIQGHPFVVDLQRMPHLLVGGFTGSGKSVAINSMIMSILFKATPAEVRFILIDPKRVELGMYEKLPHLLTPIISDPREAARALRWAVREMRERYALLAGCKVRNLSQYNSLLADGDARRLALESHPDLELRPLPFIVVIIDELADLMMLCRAEVEDAIGHLSQMARAVGIHLIFATQRPSVDIITGVVKANLPCRIAFKVRTRFDSRTILDTDGAECLLGMGDMLYLGPGTSRPVRVHGCLVREDEILTVLKHLRRLGKPEFDQRVLQEPEPGVGGDGGDEMEDVMYEQAARLVVGTRKASASFIQRKLKLGYARAARLLDMMETQGLVGPSQGARGREVLVPPDYFEEMAAARAAAGEEMDDD